MTPAPTTDSDAPTGDSGRAHGELDEGRPDDVQLAVLFPFAFDVTFARVAGVLGIRPGTAYAEIAGPDLRVVFGPWQVVTELANIEDATVTGPYTWPKVIGPPHLSVRDRGLTFATNAREGVCVKFHRPVPGLLPVPWLRHPALTITVEDTQRLAAALRTAGQRVAEEGEEGLEDLATELEDDLHGRTAAELRQQARALGIPGASKLRKAELIEAIEDRARDLAAADLDR